MTCIKDDMLQKYLDRESSIDENLRMDEHLNHCTVCAKRLEQLQIRANRIKDLILSMEEEMDEVKRPLPNLFEGRTSISASQDIHRIEPSENGWKPLKRVFLGIGVACALALVFILTPKAYPEKSQDVLLMQQEFVEIDANRPYSEQETTITVIDTDGNASYSK